MTTHRYVAGRDFALWCFMGAALVFDGGRPSIYSGHGPLFDEPIRDGDVIVSDGTSFSVQR